MLHALLPKPPRGWLLHQTFPPRNFFQTSLSLTLVLHFQVDGTCFALHLISRMTWQNKICLPNNLDFPIRLRQIPWVSYPQFGLFRLLSPNGCHFLKPGTFSFLKLCLELLQAHLGWTALRKQLGTPMLSQPVLSKVFPSSFLCLLFQYHLHGSQCFSCQAWQHDSMASWPKPFINIAMLPLKLGNQEAQVFNCDALKSLVHQGTCVDSSDSLPDASPSPRHGAVPYAASLGFPAHLSTCEAVRSGLFWQAEATSHP